MRRSTEIEIRVAEETGLAPELVSRVIDGYWNALTEGLEQHDPRYIPSETDNLTAEELGITGEQVVAYNDVWMKNAAEVTRKRRAARVASPSRTVVD